MSSTYKILIVDDKKQVLERIKREIRPRVTVGDQEWRIDIVTIHVQVVEDGSDRYKIARTTLDAFASAAQTAFDLLLIDFGYVKEGSETVIQETIKNYANEFDFEKLDGILLTPKDIIAAIYEEKPKGIRSVINNFINHKDRILVYTYIPPDIRKYVPSSLVRENITLKLFPKAKSIEVFDAAFKLFNDAEFADVYRTDYYSYLVSRFLENEIRKYIAEDTIKRSSRIRITNTTKAIATIVWVSGSIAAISAYVGSLIVDLIVRTQYIPALTLLVAVSFGVIFLGKYLVAFLEKRFGQLID